MSRRREAEEAREKSTKEEIEDSINPEEGENNIKLSIKKVGTGTTGGESEKC